MITEIAQIDVKPGTEKDFEAAVAKARPLQAAWTSLLAFATGAIFPLLAISVAPATSLMAVTCRSVRPNSVTAQTPRHPSSGRTDDRIAN